MRGGWLWLQRGLLVALGLALGLAVGLQSKGIQVHVPGWGVIWSSGLGVGAIGVAFGIVAALVLRGLWNGLWRSRAPAPGVVYPNPLLGGVTFAVIAVVAAMVDSGVRAELVAVDRGAVGFALAVLAFVSGVSALSAIQRGDSVELETHWGGLGGALGGWRVSPLAILILFVLMFSGGATALLLPRTADEPGAANVSQAGAAALTKNAASGAGGR